MRPALTRREAIEMFSLFVAGSPLLRGQFISRQSHERIPSLDEIANVLEFEPLARAKMLQRDYDYIAGGVEGEASLRRNRKAFDWVTLVPRAIADVSSIDFSTSLFGHKMKSPLLVAPTAGHQQLHPEGEKDTHRGATAAGVTMAVSSVSSYPLEDIAAAADGPLYFQLYVHQDLQLARERVEKANAAGCQALYWTVDAQYVSHRERLLDDAHLGSPPQQDARQAAVQRRRARRLQAAAPSPYGVVPESPDQDWSFIETLRGWTKLPILVKGLLTAEDAELAVQHGLDGVVVSNHGARYMPDVPATIEVLPEIVDAVAGRIPVIVDGGFRRGSDILKALAIGASAVQVGRPPLWGLGAFGAAGTERVLEILQAELALAMAQTGCSRLADISRDLVEMNFP